MTPAEGTRVYRSRAHPGEASYAAVFAGALVPALAACLLPVLIVTLVAVLEGARILGLLAWGYPGASAAAVLWTRHRVRRTLAELHVSDGFVAVRSVWAVATRQPLEWLPILEVRDYGSWVLLTAGLESFELERAAWPFFELQ